MAGYGVLDRLQLIITVMQQAGTCSHNPHQG